MDMRDIFPDEPMPNRVPEATPSFWLIKLMAVTMGETAADYLAVNLGFGLTATSLFMAAVLAFALFLQFRQKPYVPWAYWLAVVLISVVGTLVTDNLVDNFGVRLETITILFTAVLIAIFAIWYAAARTLSIHSIDSGRRETWYWLAILFTFALGTAAGDLVAERFELGYLNTGLLFGVVIMAIVIAYYAPRMNGVVAFWLAYIFTRPLGASFGDLLSQPRDYGGLGFGTTLTSLLFLMVILVTVFRMTVNADLRDDPDMLSGNGVATPFLYDVVGFASTPSSLTTTCQSYR
jgi:uncharacterized membrane-anchored protein